MKLLAGITVKAGTKIELPATVTGKPEPKITWTKADMLLKQDNRITIENVPKKSTVTITDSKRSDTGTYIIEAVNTCGRATAVVEVNVLGKGGSGLENKKHPNFSYFLEFKKMTKKKKTHTCLLCICNVDKPGPPAAFDITEVTNESCLLTWNPPRDDGGSKITNYVVERRATDSEVWHKLSSTVKDTNFKATKLTPNKEYIFRVAAENMYGVGEPVQAAPITAKYQFGELLNQLVGEKVCIKLALRCYAYI